MFSPPHLAITPITTSTPPLFLRFVFCPLINPHSVRWAGPACVRVMSSVSSGALTSASRLEFRFFDCPSLSAARSVHVPCPLAGSDPEKHFLNFDNALGARVPGALCTKRTDRLQQCAGTDRAYPRSCVTVLLFEPTLISCPRRSSSRLTSHPSLSRKVCPVHLLILSIITATLRASLWELAALDEFSALVCATSH